MSARSGSGGPSGHFGGFGVSASLAGRLRSTSPARRALALDMRRLAGLLRDVPLASPMSERQASGSNSVCSSPHSGWEPGDRGAAPMRSARDAGGSRLAVQQQVQTLADQLKTTISGIQKQCDSDRRRLSQLERRTEVRPEETHRADAREKLAEVQGSVSGLIEEVQALARRVEGLDERLWARTSGVELARQRQRELEQQVQSLEQQSRMAAAAAEEATKRQVGRVRRIEQTTDDLTRHFARLEEQLRGQAPATARDSGLEVRVHALETHRDEQEAELRALQGRVEETYCVGKATAAPPHAHNHEERLEEAERGLAELEKRVQDSRVAEHSKALASLRVKVDGAMQRMTALAERLETAHEPPLEALRGEIHQSRLQDRREIDTALDNLRNQLVQAQEGHEEAVSSVREQLRQSHLAHAAKSPRTDGGDQHPLVRGLHERIDAHEHEVSLLRAHLESLPLGGAEADDFEDRLADALLRLDRLEDGSSEAKEVARRHAQEQEFHQDNRDKICGLVEQVSRLAQRATSGDATLATLQEKLQQLQCSIEQVGSEGHSARGVAEVDARVGAVSHQVADLAARLVELEAHAEYAREAPRGRLAEGIPPLPGHDGERTLAADRGATLAPRAEWTAERLEALAQHCEIVDDLSERVSHVEQRLGAGGSSLEASPRAGALAACRETSSDLEELYERLHVVEGELQALREDVVALPLELQKLAPPMSAHAQDGQGLHEVHDRIDELAEKASNALARCCDLSRSLSRLEARAPQFDEAARATQDIKERLEQLQQGHAGHAEALDRINRHHSQQKEELAGMVATRHSPKRAQADSLLGGDLSDDVHERLLAVEEQMERMRASRGGPVEARPTHQHDDVQQANERLDQLSLDFADMKDELQKIGRRHAEHVELLERVGAKQTSQGQNVERLAGLLGGDKCPDRLHERLSALEMIPGGLHQKGAVEVRGISLSKDENLEAALGGLASLREKTGKVELRLAAVEGEVSSLRGEVQAQAQTSPASSRKVGISVDMESSVSGRIDELSEQVATLQQKLDSKNGKPVPDEADAPGLPAEGSLNFSLTEPMREPGAEHAAPRRFVGGIRGMPMDASGSADSMLSSSGSAVAVGSGMSPRKEKKEKKHKRKDKDKEHDASNEADKLRSDASLAPLKGGLAGLRGRGMGPSDALDAILGGGPAEPPSAGTEEEPRSLATVAEEADGEATSDGWGGGRLARAFPSIASELRSPTLQPQADEGSQSLTSQFEADVSVADSTELDTCDHVEDVRPCSSHGHVDQNHRGGLRPAPLERSRGEVSALTLEESKSDAGRAASATSSPKREPVPTQDDPEYADDSFADDMSVPESIEEDAGNEEDDAWG